MEIKWLCPNSEKGCKTTHTQLLPMREEPTHNCSYNQNRATKLVMSPETKQSEKMLAIRVETRYGNSHPTEKTSGQTTHKGNDMAKRTAPDAAPDETTADTTESPKAAKAAGKPKAAAKPKAEKAAPKPKAEKAPKEPVAEGDRIRRTLGDRGHLADSVEDIFRKHEAGKLKVDGKVFTDPLTVHKTRLLILNSAAEMPSTGAVSAVFARWAEAGYIKVTGRPVAFTGFGPKWTAAKMGSLAKFLDAEKERKAKERAATKAAAA
jgi:hypothetical protein